MVKFKKDAKIIVEVFAKKDQFLANLTDRFLHLYFSREYSTVMWIFKLFMLQFIE